MLGPVVDVKFTGGDLPAIYEALKVTNPTISESKDNLT